MTLSTVFGLVIIQLCILCGLIYGWVFYDEKLARWENKKIRILRRYFKTLLRGVIR